MKFEKINRYTRAGREGKLSKCPHCQRQVMIYHFAWSASGCSTCKKMVDKYDWLVEVAS